jgi:hypothetical protein
MIAFHPLKDQNCAHCKSFTSIHPAVFIPSNSFETNLIINNTFVQFSTIFIVGELFE